MELNAHGASHRNQGGQFRRRLTDGQNGKMEKNGGGNAGQGLGRPVARVFHNSTIISPAGMDSVLKRRAGKAGRVPAAGRGIQDTAGVSA
jgi:hypothetical protein